MNSLKIFNATTRAFVPRVQTRRFHQLISKRTVAVPNLSRCIKQRKFSTEESFQPFEQTSFEEDPTQKL